MKTPRTSEQQLKPSRSRLQHGRVELVAETVKDADGRPAQPYIAVDAIEALLRRGTISKEMALAADRFRIAFRIAHLDPLRAADVSRIPGLKGKVLRSADMGKAHRPRRRSAARRAG